MNDLQMQEYFSAHAVDGALPDAEVVKLLTGTADEAIGETGDTDGDAPTPAETEATEAETPEAKAQADAQPEPPVIMAKDGKNTIPYSELVDAREEAQRERSRNAELERRLAELEARIQQGGTAPQAADEGAEEDVEEEPAEDPLAALREDWPEVADALAKVAAAQQRQIETLNGQMAPIQQSEAERMRVRHYASILEAHPDADAMFESESFVQWLDTQPSFFRDVQEAVLQRGTASQVIELFDDFKRSTGWGKDTGDNAVQTQQDKQAAVRQAQQQANKGSTPKSLSDIPGGAAVQTDPTEAFIAMSETARMDKIMGMSPDAIEAMLRRAT